MESSAERQSNARSPASRVRLDLPASRRAESVAAFRPGRRRQVVQATRHLATLLAAGFTLDRALETAARLTRDSVVGAALRGVREEVRGGKTLAASLAAYPRQFGEFYRGMAAAGERSGRLAPAFRRLAEHLERASELRSRVVSTLIYPAIMVAVGSAAVLVLLLFVIPRFAEILGDVGGELPWSARALVALSDAAAAGWWAAALALAAAVIAAVLHRRTPEGRLAQDRWLLRIPVLGPLRARLATERVARTLAGALDGGIPLLEALDIAADASGDAAFRRELESAAESVRRGEALSASLRRGGRVPELALQMIEAGEESGQLAEMLEQAAATYREETERALRTLVSLVEPAVILAFGAAVAFVALALLQTIYGIGATF